MPPVRVGLCYDPTLLLSKDFLHELKGTDLLLFPELMDTGYAGLRAGAVPHRAGDPLLSACADVSRRSSLALVAPVVFQDSQRKATNSALVFRRGRIVHRYDKIHLFRPMNDHRLFRPGSSISTFTLATPAGRIRCGIVICFDLRFPELIRSMAVSGLDLLLVPARWPSVRDDAWHTLLKARAIENQCFVVGCDAKGAEGGYSYAFGPSGAEIFSNRRAPKKKLDLVSCDRAAIYAAQQTHRNIAEAVVLRSIRPPRRIVRR
jgi:predicted amidohydrolase